MNKIDKAFEDNYTVVAMSASKEYVPYLSVCLQSLIDNASENHNYDILVFERNIDDENKDILKKHIESDRVSLRFLNPMEIISQYDLKFPSHYNLECFFRLTSPILLENYEKVLFTDVDLVFQADAKDLYNTDIKDYPLAACKDLMWGALVNTKSFSWQEYAENVLQIKDLYSYFNTGVMVLNIEMFNKNNYTYQLLKLVEKISFRILEQDGMNAFFEDKIKYIDTAWNYPVANDDYQKILNNMPNDFRMQYEIDRNKPKVIHWAGKSKPWHFTKEEEEKANIWWQYARKTPYYEVILSGLMDTKIKNGLECKSFFQYILVVLNYWRCKLLVNFVSAKNKKYYVDEKSRLKDQIKAYKDG